MESYLERPLDEAPLYLLRRALQAYTAQWQETVRELTPPQFVVLRILRASPDIDQVGLSELSRVDTATLAPLLARLEDGGHVRRRVDPGNRRRKLIRLTDEGHRLLARVAPLAAATEQALLGDLGDAERATFTAVLRRIAGHRPER